MLCERSLTGIGQRTFLDRPSTAFFSSRQCPGSAIRAATDWAIAQAKAKNVVMSGFHSPLEQSVLEILLVARSPAIIVLARAVDQATIVQPWQDAIREGHLTMISENCTNGSSVRLTKARAQTRNELIATLATKICIAHASETGSLAMQVAKWRTEGRMISMLSAPQH